MTLDRGCGTACGVLRSDPAREVSGQHAECVVLSERQISLLSPPAEVSLLVGVREEGDGWSYLSYDPGLDYAPVDTTSAPLPTGCAKGLGRLGEGPGLMEGNKGRCLRCHVMVGNEGVLNSFRPAPITYLWDLVRLAPGLVAPPWAGLLRLIVTPPVWDQDRASLSRDMKLWGPKADER
ncbi:hypothetical protein DPEC_G00044970 [Dallia pectoralis]|uniref:Uncharacterized protein n=1 Tax=Dallia pectoralis TaxID=75939 RepID=A0ACC2HAT3_DALPE|nr:hypothetical protein DPEC_G00044970 [Dallia pectoralis]